MRYIARQELMCGETYWFIYRKSWLGSYFLERWNTKEACDQRLVELNTGQKSFQKDGQTMPETRETPTAELRYAMPGRRLQQRWQLERLAMQPNTAIGTGGPFYYVESTTFEWRDVPEVLESS